jgi:hypothetical protein
MARTLYVIVRRRGVPFFLPSKGQTGRFSLSRHPSSGNLSGGPQSSDLALWKGYSPGKKAPAAPRGLMITRSKPVAAAGLGRPNS